MLYTMRVRKRIYYDVEVEADSVRKAIEQANKTASSVEHQHWIAEEEIEKTTIQKMK